ncbi:hypothetical protein GCM10010172_60690 [Paractinoplanes ferrugineus]|uniref:Zinc-ribbon domain-containing protein n=1 Tax=Paractinoplanes ferrugineus TaxID=113564 RepID=A0A919J5W1_9ACTN|nr:zinc-ribbon domain-containing protein [Actinoplanes ferrugineus]GIE14603.1 hypothetical protein Afe05nite_64430 [Actinoplanes ferrugineus]
MPETYGQVRQMPCPDCGNPVMPDRDQLCANCGYPLMFLRKGGGTDDAGAQAIPRKPNEAADETSLRAVPQPVPRTDTRQFPATNYGAQRGQAPCRSCGYPNEAARVRCERCGFELRPARPNARTLAPAMVARPQPVARSWGWLLILLIVLAGLSVLTLAATLVWYYLG